MSVFEGSASMKKVLFAFALVAVFSSSALAASRYWDSDGNGGNNIFSTGPPVVETGFGGAGTWDTTNAKWWDGSSSTDVVWNNSGADDAIFGSTVGVIQINFAA